MSINLNKLVVAFDLFGPSVIEEDEQIQLQPFDYKLESLDGFRLNTPVGKGKVTFISYWATWCPPCIAELPSIEKLYAEYGNKVTFLLITNEDPQVVSAFLERKDFNIPAAIPKMNAPKLLYEKTIPTNYIINKEGEIIVKQRGAANWNSKEIRALLDTLL